MKKKLVLLVMAAALGSSLVACGKKDVEVVSDNDSKAQQEEQVEAPEEEASSPASEEENTDGVAEETTEEANADFSYADFKLKEFYFASGVGGWDTTLKIKEDGTFSGSYHDSDMGSTGEGYQYGTLYWCEFTGKLGAPEKINDYTYSAKIEELKYANDPGQEEIIDEILYVYSEAYGLSGTDHLLIYTPEAPVSELSDDYMSWVNMARWENPESETLGFYGLFNEDEGDGFSSYDVEDPDPYKIEETVSATYSSVDEELAAIQAVHDNMYADPAVDNMNQNEMNNHAYMNFKLWDDELNSIWGRLGTKLTKEEMDKLREEQRAWIEAKEKKVEEEGSKYEGGSIRPLIEYTTASEMTEARVKELIELLR